MGFVCGPAAAGSCTPTGAAPACTGIWAFATGLANAGCTGVGFCLVCSCVNPRMIIILKWNKGNSKTSSYIHCCHVTFFITNALKILTYVFDLSWHWRAAAIIHYTKPTTSQRAISLEPQQHFYTDNDRRLSLFLFIYGCSLQASRNFWDTCLLQLLII